MSQPAADSSPEDFPLDPAVRQAVLTGLLDQLDSYVFPEVAEQIRQDIQQRLANGGYGDVTGGMQLADTVTAQLQTLSQDPQLRLYFSPDPLPHLEPAAEPTPAEIARQQHLSSLRNFDFNRVERWRGNVGYLELFGFEPPEFAGETAAAAMAFLAHTSALIIDLRHNRGGSPGMVALLCSYLFPAYPSLHLNDLYWRTTDSTHQWWTLPYVPGQRYLDKPVFVLIGQTTFSAAEEFAYNLQTHQRATIVGETSRGGAHPGSGHRLHDHFWVFIPNGRAINPITGTNWNGTGVIPDVKVPAELAPKTAHLIVLTQLLEGVQEPAFRRELEEALQTAERELNQQRQDLISQLGVRS
ncbi:S41 family peptidase [Pseudanabaena sp. FACHB-2040]|uniref:S41 family peptidase n=1 Tax=Pseudanabaena sp. FACHB-2040 TaxID=2692859 RepID=UPI00168444B0|nr:S41 family peptidase [Pseudanabaena sp. FACHB-2040]MBD2257576.1 S41 family peptidase [Pseudanabaena sp. FACHB-2040]